MRCAVPALFWAFTAMAAPLTGEPVRVPEPFDSEKGEHRTDASGIACRAEAAPGAFRCLVVDDQRRQLRTARLAGDALTFTGAPIRLVRNAGPVDAAVVGTIPDIACGGGTDDDPFDDCDGEAVAFAADGTAYVVGSHGCSRTKDLFASGAFLLSRLVPGADGGWSVRQTYRLTEALHAAPALAPFVGRSLNRANGLNIEGIAVRGDTLLVGLRAPVLDGAAQILRVPLVPLFATGPLPPVATIALRLGAETGIRDLALTPDDRLLVLAGPAQEQDLPATLWLANATTGPHRLAELAPVHTRSTPATCPKLENPEKAGKAEGVTVLEQTAEALRVLVLFDGLCDGEPHLYTVPLPP